MSKQKLSLQIIGSATDPEVDVSGTASIGAAWAPFPVFASLMLVDVRPAVAGWLAI